MDTPSSSDGYRHNGNVVLAPASAPAPPPAAAPLSNDHTPTPNNAGRKRRASGVPGSRGVANLSKEQLEKKRANDREAQRAIRERTRKTIETLEQRIRELESQHPFQELQRVVHERDQALAECDSLRRRLDAVAGIVGAQSQAQPGSETQPGLNELAAYTARQSPLPPRSQQQSQSQSPAPSFKPPARHLHPDLRSPLSQSEGTPHSMPTASSQAYRTPTPSSNSSLSGPLSDPQRAPPTQGQHASGERLGLNFLLESSNAHQPPTSTTPTSQVYHSPLETPIYARLTSVGPSSCPLDSLLIDFVKRRREMLRDGVAISEVLGPDYPDFSAMCYPGSSTHPVSAFFIDVLTRFPDVCSVPERVAVFYVMFLVLRWLVCPCQTCYERLPEWCRPIQEQFDISHVAYADYLPWPHMRKHLCLAEFEVNFGDFFVPYTRTLSLNFPHPDDRVLLQTPSSRHDQPTLTMSQMFEQHLRTLENWSLGSAFQNKFPHLVDAKTMRIKD